MADFIDVSLGRALEEIESNRCQVKSEILDIQLGPIYPRGRGRDTIIRLIVYTIPRLLGPG